MLEACTVMRDEGEEKADMIERLVVGLKNWRRRSTSKRENVTTTRTAEVGAKGQRAVQGCRWLQSTHGFELRREKKCE